MEKVDRLGWAAGLGVACFGRTIGIRVSTPEGLPLVRDLLPPGCRPLRSAIVDRLYSFVLGGPGPDPRLRRYHLVYANSLRIARSHDLEAARAALESDLRLYVAERAKGRVFVHAGVVAWGGRALLLPGHSHSGKSRLVAELVRAGATYYSDEYAVLDPRGRVHPFAAPLSLRGDEGERPTRIAADALGGPGTAPLSVGLVAVSRYRRGGRWRPRRLTQGQGALALLAHTVPARGRPRAALAALGAAVRDAEVWQGIRGEAGEAAAALLARLGRAS